METDMQNSIRRRLTIAFIGLAIGPLLLVGLVLGVQSFTVQRQQAITLQRQIARHVSAEMRSFIRELESGLAMVVRGRGMLELERDQQQASLYLPGSAGAVRRRGYRGST